MPEFVEFSRIGKPDLHTGPEPFEVRLADGRVYTMPPVDVGYWYNDATTQAALSAADPTGLVRRLTDATRGLWRHGGGGHWYDISGGHYNVQAFGAWGDGAHDDTAAIQAAIDACQAADGGCVYVPPGTYLLSSALTLSDDNVNLLGASSGRASALGACLRAAVAMENMIVLSGTPLKFGGSIRNLCLDAYGLADWIIQLDGWRQFEIMHNTALDARVGFIHTNYSGVSDMAALYVAYNRASATGTNLAQGQGMSYFFYTEQANSRTTNPADFVHNVHSGFGRGPNSASWSLYLDHADRVRVNHHFAQPFETGTFDGIVKVSNSTSGAGGVSGRHTFLCVTAEWGSQTAPLFLIDGTYSGAGGASTIRGCRILYPQGQPNNDVVKLDVSGSNAAVEGTVVQFPINRMTASDTITVASASVTKTVVQAFTGSGSALDTQVVNSGSSTSLQINGVTSRSLAHAAPSDGAFEVGTFVYDSDSKRFWGMGHEGVATALTAGAVERAQLWLTSSTQAAQAPVSIPANAYLLRAHLHVTEAFDSDGTDLIRCGTSANGTNIFADVDVSTTGIKTVTLGGQAGYSSSSRAVHGTYTNSGSEPTTGKACIVVEWTRMQAQP